MEHRRGVRLDRDPVLRPHARRDRARSSRSRPRRSTPGGRRPSARRGSAADGWRCGSSRSRATAPCARAPRDRRACRRRLGCAARRRVGFPARPPGRARSMIRSFCRGDASPIAPRHSPAFTGGRAMLKYTIRTSRRDGAGRQMSETMRIRRSGRAPYRRDRERGAADRGAEGAGRGGGRVSAHRGVGRRLLRVSVRAQLRRPAERRTISCSSATGSRSSSTTCRSTC